MVWLASEFFEEGYLETVSHETKLSQETVLGKLILLWHISQRRKKTFVSPAEIVSFSRVGRNQNRWIDSLCGVGLLFKHENGLYEIAGNAKRLAAIEKKRETGKEYAERRWKDKKSDGSTHDLPNGLPIDHPMGTQCNDSDSDSDLNKISYMSTYTPPTKVGSIPMIENKLVEIKKTKPVPFKIFDLWNLHHGCLPSAQRFSTARASKDRLRVLANPDSEFWVRAILKMTESDFCKSGTWANYDWLVANDNNGVKAEGGNYDNKDAAAKIDWDYVTRNAKFKET